MSDTMIATTVSAPKPGELYPCCQRKVPAAKASGPADRKLKEDTRRAELAIAVCIRQAANMEFSPALRESISDEAERLHRALVDLRLLWSIYRRRDSGPTYVPSAGA
jgi:hypothetical protein